MKVWVVIEDTGTTSVVDGWLLVGVYSSEEKARAAEGYDHPEWTTVLEAEVYA